MEEPLYAEAVLVRDGVIERVGTRAELSRRCPDAEPVDLEGHVLMPAFIDSHSHITAYAQTMGLIDLGAAKSFDEIAAKIEQYRRASKPKPGEWIIGFGYDHNALKEHAHPPLGLLDRAAPENPLLLSNKSGHMGVANSIALRELGITRDTPDPEGGKFGRAADGSLTGYLEENAFLTRTGSVPKPSMETRLSQIEQAQEVYLSFGIATVQDGLTREPELRLLEEAAKKERLKVDVVSYVDLAGCAEAGRRSPYWNRTAGRLRLGGYKIFLDGSPQGKTAWMTKPYEGEREYRGYPVHTDEALQKLVDAAYREGEQLLAHCNGDAAADQFLAAAQRAQEAFGKRGLRPVMIHAQTVREDQLDKMKALGVIPSFFVAHVHYWGETHRKNLGEDRAAHISPVASAVERGIPFTLHQDTPVLPPDMLKTVWCAVNRLTVSGKVLGKGERVSALDALRGVTTYAAYQYHQEDHKGSIRAGKRADFAVLDRDPLKAPEEEIDRIKVLATIVGGECRYRREN